ncbi:DUF7523 family protein [Halohasta salina]|uniref:DUF7523 family protein n=1 Tax=Halohasta salina TaxID=2961621 RepID=UPI0020A3A25F|nr:hypothetical protein [Halohasta salina]
MSLAAATREAVRDRPALYEALAAGVVNYTAAAESLDVDGDREAIATALRRFAADLEPADTGARSITVRLHSDAETVEEVLSVDGATAGGSGEAGDEGAAETPAIDDPTAVAVTGAVDARLLAAVLGRLRIAGVPVGGAGMVGGSLVVVVPRREGATAVRLIESVAESG